MALIHEFDKVIERVTRITADLKFNRWSRDELIDYINEGQREYCEKSMNLRAEGPILNRENSEIYTLPNDCYRVDRIERSDGCTIEKTTSRDLERAQGSRYRIARGQPTHYYQDLDGQRQLRFYPVPTENVLSTYRDVDGELGIVTQAGVSEINPLIVDGVEIVDENDPLYIATHESLGFDSELGVTVDSTEPNEDGEDDNTFNFDEGAVQAVINGEGKFRVWYVRYPREDIFEIDDLQALQYYALHKCYEKDGPVQNIDTSMLYERRFQERINREIGRVSSGQSANMSSRGYYA
jgi:hypothetical protein